jgi:hypothetical protein
MCVLLLPGRASAQATTASGIAGVVRDGSGAVLPGVTVEAASPALIEKVKVAVTDNEGRYNIIDLRTGTYSVTFTLPGFSVFVRDGIVLTAGFTAQVNAEMRVGAVEETITVTGESPLIDTQTARSQVVVSSDLLNALPSSVKNLNNLVALTPGYRGNEGFDVTGGYTGQVGATYHGKGGTKVTFDGMSIQHSYGNQGYNQNQEVVQETVLSTSGITAESNADGVQINLVPKEGGNIFAGSAFGLYSGSSLQSNNLSDELRGFGLLSATSVNYVFDAGASLGGPIMKDKMWFYGSYRQWGNERGAAGKYYNATQGTFFYTPDLSRPAFGHEHGVQGHPVDLADDAEEQAERLRGSPARLPLPGDYGERIGERAGGVFQLSADAGGAVSGHLDGTGDQPVPARGGHGRGAWQLAAVHAAGSPPGRHLHAGAHDRRPVQLDAVQPVRAARAAVLAAGVDVLRHRVARVQGRVAA